eukprot:TRINITY_DN5697_c0_g3_i2.p1 TRINITY_DN5697_c0_g3~~TRINITY_DN5697_c0_g3_i2.p1  ORF type:complete len:313 (+),score=49.66 TRINITY_DN5697_c0_g3_i2:615-1553(+)
MMQLYLSKKTKIVQGQVFQTSFVTQFILLFVRSFINELRNPMELRMKTFQAIFTAILIIIVFGDIGVEVSGVQNRNGLLFFLITGVCFGAVQGALGTFSAERPLFLRERLNKQYTVAAYFWGKGLSEFPFQIIWPWIQVSIVYFGCGLSTSLPEKYWIATLTCLAVYFTGTAYGMAMSIAIPKAEIAMAMIPILLVPLMAFGGFFVNQNKVPVYFYPFQYISPWKYAFQVLAWNEFTDNRDLKCLNAKPPTCDPLAVHNFREGMWLSLLILFLLGVIFRILAVLIMYLISTPARVKITVPQQNSKQQAALQP